MGREDRNSLIDALLGLSQQERNHLIDHFLRRELAQDGYSGVGVRMTPTRTEIIVLATRTQSVLGEKRQRIGELTFVVQKQFNFDEELVEVSLQSIY